MDEFEIAVIEAAMDCAEAESALDCGMPAQHMVKKSNKILISACATLAAENEGKWTAPDPALEFVMRRFSNGLRVLLSIDEPDFVAAGGYPVDWPEFRENPHMWFIRASDDVAGRLWAIIRERTR